MGAPSREEEEAKKMEAGGDTVGQKLDAGALFVLQSKGSWLHCGYHLTTSIVAPPLLSLPFAFAALGWSAGMVCLVVGAAVTFYSYNLLSRVLEHHAQQGRRQLRFRDMAADILGPGWARYYIGPIQFMVCFGAVVASTLLAGQSMKAIYLIASPGGAIKLYVFVAIFGVFLVILAQLPSFHSLRHVNLVSLLLCLSYSLCAVAGCVYLGTSDRAPPKDYSIVGDTHARVYGVFNALAVIATTYGNGIIPEIQATVAAPVTGKMFKGLCLCYAVVVTTFFSVATAGYWAFGNAAQGLLLNNFMVDGRPVIPVWLLLMAELFTLVQLSATATVYLQPTNEVLEGLLSDPKAGQYAARNVVPRLVSRTLAVAFGTTIAAMIPFFGDMNALIGAFGFMPLDFAVPALFYNLTFKPSKKGFVFWLNTAIAVVFSAVAIVASVAAVRQIVLDAGTYKLFANV
ncbi:GABA transporter 1-like [Triticum dicoccoides]|uniref:Amino acid transporter transmembrane domain-containing protein n=1 Tax=Triticum aestivum TaxID=4565 RepID=A0A3B6ENP4_WHEAT|nr:GABA transporter 1-like [Triticum dicoccoides]XP_044342199.1 GABA transporter 1-like [Triticum aestivum]